MAVTSDCGAEAPAAIGAGRAAPVAVPEQSPPQVASARTGGHFGTLHTAHCHDDTRRRACLRVPPPRVRLSARAKRACQSGVDDRSAGPFPHLDSAAAPASPSSSPSSPSSSPSFFSTSALPNNAPPLAPASLVVQLKLKAFHPFYLNRFVLLLAARLQGLGLPRPSQVFLPKKTERWTVLRGPHIDKKARDQFERVTHKRLITIRVPRGVGAAADAGGIGGGLGAGAANSGSNVELAYRLLRSVANISADVTVRAKYLVSMGERVHG